MNALMTNYATLAAETLFTNSAGVRLLIGMPGRMFFQFLFSSETAVAQVTMMR